MAEVCVPYSDPFRVANNAVSLGKQGVLSVLSKLLTGTASKDLVIVK